MQGRALAGLVALTLAVGGVTAAVLATRPGTPETPPTDAPPAAVPEVAPAIAPLRHRVTLLPSEPAASPADETAAAETKTVRRRLRLEPPPRPEGWGEVFVRDLTRDLHVVVDGESESVRRIHLPPGMHAVVLADRHGELGRLDVAIVRDATTEISIADFPVDSVCMTRWEGEPLRKERPDRGGLKCGTECDLALRWLARHPSPSGLWSARRFDQQCRGKACSGTSDAIGDTETTALVLLAYLGYGDTHVRGEYRDVVKAGLKALLARRGDDGRFGTRREHAMATLVLTEAFACSESLFIGTAARPALDVLLAAPPAEDVETACFEAFALHSARADGKYRHPLLHDELPSAVDAHVTRMRHDLRAFGPPERHAPHDAALLIAARALLVPRAPGGGDADVRSDVRDGLTLLTRSIDDAISDGAPQLDPLALYLCTVSALQLDAGARRAWAPRVQLLVISTQNPDGTWESGPEDALHPERDRVTTTALRALTLQIHYRYGCVFGGPP